jgi:hypothetical protein
MTDILLTDLYISCIIWNIIQSCWHTQLINNLLLSQTSNNTARDIDQQENKYLDFQKHIYKLLSAHTPQKQFIWTKIGKQESKIALSISIHTMLLGNQDHGFFFF